MVSAAMEGWYDRGGAARSEGAGQVRGTATNELCPFSVSGVREECFVWEAAGQLASWLNTKC